MGKKILGTGKEREEAFRGFDVRMMRVKGSFAW